MEREIQPLRGGERDSDIEGVEREIQTLRGGERDSDIEGWRERFRH